VDTAIALVPIPLLGAATTAGFQLDNVVLSDLKLICVTRIELWYACQTIVIEANARLTHAENP